jgi:hypothetical protein
MSRTDYIGGLGGYSQGAGRLVANHLTTNQEGITLSKVIYRQRDY